MFKKIDDWLNKKKEEERKILNKNSSPKFHSNKQNSQQKNQKHTGRVFKNTNNNSGNSLKIIPLGGTDNTTKNLMVYEYDGDIVLVDMGFAFPEEDMPGIDFLIPDITDLIPLKHKIRAVIITHGHMDHFGSIPQLMPKLGMNIPIYAPDIAAAMITERQKEFEGKLNVKTYNKDTVLKLGRHFSVDFYHINHNVPSAFGVRLKTPAGAVIQTGDWKFDHSPIENDPPADVGKIARMGAEGILAMVADSTNAPQPGYQISESKIKEELDKVFRDSENRIIVTVFSSHLGRMQQIISLAEKHGRKVIVDGMSMKKNIEIMIRLKYLRVKPDTFVDRAQFKRIPRNKVLALVSGAMGQHRSALLRIADEEHAHLSVEPGDKVVFSSSVVPGNEATVAALVDKFYKKRVDVVNYKMMDIHAGGHAKQEELKMMIRLVNPKYFIPISGDYSYRVIHGKLAHSMGMAKKNIFLPDEGSILEFKNGLCSTHRDKWQTRLVAVDGNMIGEIGSQVMRDRKDMASGGVFVVIFKIDQNHKLVGKPEVVSRGFVFMRESRELIHESEEMAKKFLMDAVKEHGWKNMSEVKWFVRKKLTRFFLKKTDREPLVVPTIVRV